MGIDHTDMAALNKSFAEVKPFLNNADAICFDLDGTLADTEGDALDLIRGVISKHVREQFNLAGIDTCYRHLAGKKLPDIIAVAEAEVGKKFSPEMKTAIEDEIKVERKNSLIPGAKADSIRMIAAFAQYVKEQGMPYCVVTASEPERALFYIRAADLDHIFDEDPSKWLFASNLQPKMDAHREARTRLSEIHGIDIDPRRCIVLEDSPSAVKQGVEAGAIVLPHTLHTHISEEHLPARTLLLQQTKLDALKANNIVEFTRIGDGSIKPITAIEDVQVIRTEQDFVPVLVATLSSLPPRPALPHAKIARR